jgi:fused signal recognition particle receptor
MFGFLRRKKPGEPAAAPPPAGPTADGTTAPEVPGADAAGAAISGAGASGADAFGPIDERALEAAALAAPPEDAPAAPALAQDEPAGAAAKPGFWSRFVPGARAPATAPDRGAEAASGAAVAAPVPASQPLPGATPAVAPASVTAPATVPASATAPAVAPSSGPSSAPSSGPGPSSVSPAASASAAADDPAATLVPAPLPDRRPWLARLRQGLSRTSGNLATLFVGVKVDEALFDELETALLVADAGVSTTAWLLAALRERVRRDRLTDPMQVKAALRALLAELLTPLEQPIDIDRAEPLVIMITGVNGAGKTTSIGKLARHLRREGKSVLLAAGDTFRAAAREQLAQWGSRNEVEVIAQQGGDPAPVAFDADSAGRARRTGVVMVDTAGRLPTQTHLMDELKKIRRVTAKAMDGAPHEVLLVLDGNTGQNMLAQVEAFDAAVGLTGLIVTKLDGTAKGGTLAALAHTRRSKPIPVYFIGVGEGIDDLQAFSAEEFAAALVD